MTRRPYSLHHIFFSPRTPCLTRHVDGLLSEGRLYYIKGSFISFASFFLFLYFFFSHCPSSFCFPSCWPAIWALVCLLTFLLFMYVASSAMLRMFVNSKIAIVDIGRLHIGASGEYAMREADQVDVLAGQTGVDSPTSVLAGLWARSIYRREEGDSSTSTASPTQTDS